MRTQRTTAGMVATGLVAIALGLTGPTSSEASQLPSGCVWAGVQHDSTSQTVKVDTDGTTCPSTPPDPNDPCPDGDSTHQTAVVPVLGTEAEALVCVKNLP